MGACLIMEAQVLLNWAEKEGCWPLACHGISMGGHMASLAASAWPKPIALVPCLAWTSGSVTFCQGVLFSIVMMTHFVIETLFCQGDGWCH